MLCATQQCLRCRPRRDVDHVDTNDCIGDLNRPPRISDIKVERLPHVCQWLDCSPSGNRTKTILILFGWLPCEMRHHAREVHGMLSCAASDLKNQSRLRQDL